MVSGMTFFDIGVWAVLLIFFLIGVRHGFINGVLSLVGAIVSIVAAIYFAGKFADLIQPLIGPPIDNWVNGLLVKLFNPENDPANIYQVAIGSEENIARLVGDAISKLGLPEAFTASIQTSITNSITLAVADNAAVLQENSIIDILTPIIGRGVLVLIAGIVLFIAIRIVIAIIEAVFRMILLSSGVLKSIDRLLGGVFGLIKGALTVLIVFTLATFILGGTEPNPESNDIIVKVRTNIDQSNISKVIYENNPIPQFLADNVNFDKIITDLFKSDNNEENGEQLPEDSATLPSYGARFRMRFAMPENLQ